MNIISEKYNQALAYLTINCSYLENLGLYHGKMGIVLFFSQYAYSTHNKYYEDFAGCLLDEIYEEINWDLPIDLENGLCGIGWGIEYLVQNGFMKGNTDEILSDIDRRIMEINPLHIPDLSFRKGLAGIIFYVIARLNATRQVEVLPFNTSYLSKLEKSLSNAINTDEIFKTLKTTFLKVMDGEKIKLCLPTTLTKSSISINDSLNNNSLGLENGISGLLLNLLKYADSSHNLCQVTEEYITLIDSGNRSANYGIGTYINLLKKTIQNTRYKIIHIRLFSTLTDSYSLQEENNNIFLSITGIRDINYKRNDILKKYFRNVFFIIYHLLSSFNMPIFHFNMMQGEDLLELLKSYFPKSSFILTVHYTNWSFYLLGNRKKLNEILNNIEENQNHLVYKSFISEKKIMALSDRIISISHHSYKDIIKLYQVTKEKITLIPHGLQDYFLSMSEEEKKEKRNRYGFSPDSQILIFAGRIDPIKGIEDLIYSFSLLVKQYPKMQLIIAGDGDFNSIYTKLNPFWSKIVCTGFIKKDTLYDLFSISDIGIIPSHHEEFGFVALEMMMMGLPLIVRDTTGLSELVKNGETGIIIPSDFQFKKMLCKAILSILKDKDLKHKLSYNGRKLFLETYSFSSFQKNMHKFYSELK